MEEPAGGTRPMGEPAPNAGLLRGGGDRPMGEPAPNAGYRGLLRGY